MEEARVTFPKLYLVFCDDLGDYNRYLCDIFTTRARAEADVDERKQRAARRGNREYYTIEEWEIQE